MGSDPASFGDCLFCGEELRHGDWVIKADEIRKLVIDPDNVPDGIAHRDCVVHKPGS